MPAAMLDIASGKVGARFTQPVIYLEDSWTSVLCDLKEWMINHSITPIPAPFITSTGSIGEETELLVIGDEADVEWWNDHLESITDYYIIDRKAPNAMAITYNPNATPTSNLVELAGPGDAVARSTCYGNLKGGRRTEEGEYDERQRGGGGGGRPGPGRGGGGGGPPSPHDTTLGSGDGMPADGGSEQGQGGEGGESGESGQGEGEGESGGEGGECSTCDGTGMGSGPGADDGGQSDGSDSGDSGEGDAGDSTAGSDPDGSGAPGQGSPSEDGQGPPPEICGECNGTGCETPVDDLPDNIGEEGMSETQEAANQQAAEDFAKQQAECSDKCEECADMAEEAKDKRQVEDAIEAAKAAQEVGNPRSKQDNDNMDRAKDAAHDAIEEAWDEGRITEDQAQALHDDVDSPTPSNQSEAQKLAEQARQEANQAFDGDEDALTQAAETAQQAADEVGNRNDAGSVQSAAKDIADIAQGQGEGEIEEEMRDLADQMKQRETEQQWGIKDNTTGDFLTDDAGLPQEFASPEDAQEMLDQLGDPDDMDVEPLPNRLDTAMQKAKEDFPELDLDDIQTRDEFQDQYDRTMDDLNAGEICMVTNLDGDFAPTAGETYKNLLNYAMLLNQMIGGMMEKAKKVPVMLSVMSEKKPLGLEVLQEERLEDIETYEKDAKYNLHSMDQPQKPEDKPKWAAFTYPLPPTLDANFGVNSQVRILEDHGYWVKVRPLSNSKGFMALLKANLDCYDEQAIPSDLQDLIDTPNMPTSKEDLQKLLEDARRRRARQRRQDKTVSGDAVLEYRVDIITGERRSFDKSQLLAGEAGRTFVQIHKYGGVMTDLMGLMELLDEQGTAYTVLSQKVGPTQIETNAEGIVIATQMGKPLVVRGNKVGYL